MTELAILETVKVYLKKEHLNQQEIEWLLQHKTEMLEVIQEGFVVSTEYIKEPVSDKAKQRWLEMEGLIVEKKVKPIQWWYYAAAAVAIVFIAISSHFIFNNSPVENFVIKDNFDRQPGSNVASIQLANGKILKLDSLATGEWTMEGNASIAKRADGEIEYLLSSTSSSNELQYNTMTTPMGGQYRLKLNDGTQVWLNAGSSITYPVAFGAKERRVKVKGELFFEVAEQKNHPFIVEVDEMEVQVLGTAFNVSNYDNEPEVNTTLISGAVKVLNAQDQGSDKREVKLIPGQQAIINRGNPGEMKVGEVNDLQQIVAWKNGLFNFDGSDLKTVMRQLERWYNIEVRYTRDMENMKFTGKLHRNTNLADVLNVLKLMDVKFKMEGNVLYVK